MVSGGYSTDPASKELFPIRDSGFARMQEEDARLQEKT